MDPVVMPTSSGHFGRPEVTIAAVDRRDHFLAAGFGLATLTLGALRAGDSSLWLDEAFTAQFVDRPLGEVISGLGREAGMGPYYLALWAWSQLGTSEWWLRMLSVCGAACAVTALYLLARRVIGRPLAAVTALWLACNPFFIRHLTELRAYSWTMLMGIVCTSAFITLRREPSPRAAVRYGAAVGLMLSLVSFSINLVIAQMLFVTPLIRTVRGRRFLLLAGLTAMLLFAAFVPALVTSDQLDWIGHQDWSWIGHELQLSLGGPKTGWLVAAGGACFAAFVALPRGTTSPWEMRLIASSIVLAPLTLLVLSLVRPVFISRYMSATLPLAILGATVGFDAMLRAVVPRLALSRLAFGALTAAVVVFFPGAVVHEEQRVGEMESLAEYLDSNVRSGDAVAFEPQFLDFPLRYYWGGGHGTVLHEDDLADVSAVVSQYCRVWQVSFRPASLVELLATLQRDGAESTTVSLGSYTATLMDDCDA
jgi:mannosyltransferase